jgi:L-glyceraldehyde 3-phosphate reductase
MSYAMDINDHAPIPVYVPNKERYHSMPYRRCGNSGIMLPCFSLGLWHNFGQYDNFANARQILRTALDLGITHWDLANNYGPPYGSAEEVFGRIKNMDFAPYRDELFISTKAGYDMWPGPYGNNGSRKSLTASLNQSLKRMDLDYVDLFYHHRPDPDTPIEETVYALDSLVKQGKALYVGVSRYSEEQTAKAHALFKELGTPFIIHQSRYSMLDRHIEEGLLDCVGEHDIGLIAFSPLEQGMLTDRYLKGIPENSRASNQHSYLSESLVLDNQETIVVLAEIAHQRGQSLAQMALAWLLNDQRVTSVLIGASSPQQLKENVASTEKLEFSESEQKAIRAILTAHSSS